MLVLARYADETYSCYPGQQSIADETEQSVRQVRRQLAYVEALGLITRTRRTSRGGYRNSDRYQLNLDVVVEVDRSDPRRQLLRGDPETPTGQIGRLDVPGYEPACDDDLPDSDADLPATGAPPTGHWGPSYRPLLAEELLEELPENELPETTTTSCAPAVAVAPPTAPVAEPFAVWWSAYPMKKGKVDAERKWQLAVRRGVDPGVLLAAAERYRDDPTREPAFTLWPKTWLHGGHWQDEGPARATATTVTSSRQSVTRVTAGMTEVDHQAMEGLFR